MPAKSNNSKAQTKKAAPVSESSDSETETTKNVANTKKPIVVTKKSNKPESESSDEEEVVVKVAPKTGAGKKKVESSSESESSEESSSESSSSESEEEVVKKPAPKKIVPSKKKQESSSEETETESEEESESESSEEEVSKAPGKKGKGAATKKDNLDDILGEFGVEGQKLTKAQLKRAKKKQESTTPQPKVEGVTEQLAAISLEKEGDDKKPLSKAQLARLRKKEKEQKEKEAPKPEAPEKPKQQSALAQKIKQQREELEAAKKKEADRIAEEEAQEAARIAEEKKLLEEAEKRKADKKAKRAADVKAGLVLSHADKKKARAAAQAVEAMKAAGYVVGPASGEAEAKKKRPVYAKKSKPGKGEKEAKEEKVGSNPIAEVAVIDPAIEERKKEEKQAKLDLVSEEEPDWDTMMASSEQEQGAEVLESWDVDSDEERQQQAERKEAHDKRKTERVENASKLKQEFVERKQARLARIEARKVKAKQEKEKQQAEKANAGSQEKESEESSKRKDLRSPICCILGHVDTGKTKLLDKIRHTNVQGNEASGITQQIGATNFPAEVLRQQTMELQEYIHKELDIKVPGLLVIDTPGHESFSNLRSRGSGLCDIAILVVDIMAGLEQQTIESINLLKMRKTPFVVALNKCDRMYGWKAIPNCPFKKTLDTQTVDAQQEFDRRLRQIIVAFAEQSLNTCLYWENKDFKRNISIIPTSAITGEGVPDLLMLLVQLCQKMMNERLMYLSDLRCTVLEVKVVEGLGTTMDVILANGVLHEGDMIVVCGMQGPIVTRIRALLTPPPSRELRVKSEYIHNKTVKAAAGLKISAPNLESVVPGSQLLVCGPRDDIEELKNEVMQDLATILARVDRSGIGVCVQASTLGSLEALLAFLEDSKIPVSGIAIGPVHKKDVMRAATMLERKREYAIILAFDVAVSTEAQHWATTMGVQIFTADVIYHLFTMCTNYMAEARNRSIEEHADTIVFPCILEVLPDCVFRDRAPLVLGVRVREGLLKLGTPLVVPSKQHLVLGKITSIQKNHVEVKEAKQNDEVSIKIESPNHEQKIMFGRHFDFADHLYSKITRASIDQLKLHFKDELNEDAWKLVKKLKVVFGLPRASKILTQAPEAQPKIGRAHV